MGDQPEKVKKERWRLKRKIKFEKEIVSKDEAQKLLEKSNEKHRQKPPKKQKKNENSKETTDENGTENVPKRKRNKKKQENESLLNIESENTEPLKKKKTKEETINTTDENQDSSELDPSKSKEQQEESIRARKRRKYQELLQEQKLKSELNIQQKCLNYLSQWKHSRTTWKFEKLKQVWIQHNMFDEAKIPDEFWDTVVEYFDGSKGKIKATITKDALKIIEANADTEENDEETNIKYKRARFIVQNLQE